MRQVTRKAIAILLSVALIWPSASVAPVQSHPQRTTQSLLGQLVDRPYLELLELEPASVSLDEWPAQRAEDIGDLHGGPVHSFFFRPDRLTVPSMETGSASTGLVTECRC